MIKILRGAVIVSYGLCLLVGFILSPITQVYGEDCSNPKLRCATSTPTLISNGQVTNTPTQQVTATATNSNCVPIKGAPCSTVVPSATATLTPAPPNSWVEDWSQGTSRWTDGAGNPPTCAVTQEGILHSTCGGVHSRALWDQTKPITVYDSVRGHPLDDQSYFCGLAILQDGNTYAQTAVGRDLQPAQFQFGYAGLVWWADEVTNFYYKQGTVDVDSWQVFSVSWNGSNTWTGSWNGVALPAIQDTLISPVKIDLQGGPEGPGDCQFQRVIVTGTKVN